MASESFKAVIFQVGNIEYGLPVEQVSSIERMQPILSVPNMPEHVMGVVELRGTVFPVINLRSVLKEDDPEDSEMTHIIVIKAEDKTAGLVVDDATDIIDLSEVSIHTINHINPLLQGIVKLGDRLLVLIDSKNIIKNITDIDKVTELDESKLLL